MTLQPALSAELVEFIREQLALKPDQQVSPSDSLEEKFGLTGDDADDFMGDFGKRFHVAGGDFDFNRYFVTEGFPGPFFIVSYLCSKKKRRRLKREPLTVAMLQHAINLGVWDSQRLMESENPGPTD